jgi:hypothetical protein
MSIALGNSAIATLKLGSQQVSRVMLGAQEVWSDWSPLDLSPALWLDASTLTVSDGTNLTTWPDISGNGHHMSRAASNGPVFRAESVNGRPAVEFLGNNYCMSTVSTGNWQTVFAVVKNIGGSGLNMLFSAPLGADLSVRLFTSTSYRGVITTNAGDWSLSSTSNFRINGVNTDVFSAGSYHVLSSNKSSPVINGTMALSSVYTGRTWIGMIAEFIVFSGILTTEDRQKLERYLGAKYGITVA